MQINSLNLKNVRAFEHAEFEFRPGMNLIIGINGSGKSTVLNSLRAILSRGLPRFSKSPDRKYFGFDSDDIKSGQGSLEASVNVYTSDTPIQCLVKYAGIRNSLFLKPSHSKIINAVKNNDEQPLCVFFSVRRSLPIQKSAKVGNDLGEQTVAFLDALGHRELRIQELASWWLAQSELAEEGSQDACQRLKIQQEALAVFLEECGNLQAISEPEPTLLIEKNNVTLDIRNLSDGERSILALVLDLARRLSQANTELSNPLLEGKAVVLIDEIDLHLHPRWQRTIVKKLTDTFPNCQFIATTHSPQIIGEVPPEQILILEEGKQPYRPDQSLGMDTNWILRHIMGTEIRDAKTQKDLERIKRLITDEAYDDATDAIDELRDEKGEFAELVGYQARIDRIRILGE